MPGISRTIAEGYPHHVMRTHSTLSLNVFDVLTYMDSETCQTVVNFLQKK
jgi:hypothetical protein